MRAFITRPTRTSSIAAAATLILAFWSGAAADVEDRTYFSRANRREIKIKVYTPPGYEAGEGRYPVVYSLHGGGGDAAEQWERTRVPLVGAMEKRHVRPMIYVCGDGLGNSLWVDGKGGRQAMTAVIKELVPFIDANYRTVATREGRAIEGFSMGGFGALHLAFRHPEMFSSVVAYGSALLTWDTLDETDKRENFGGDPDYFEANNPRTWAARNAAKIRGGLRVRMVIGTEDWLLARNVEVKALLDRLGVPISYEVVAGLAHCMGCAYDKVGLKGLRFIEDGFDAAAGRRAARDDYAEPLLERNVVYGMHSGFALLMDVYRPAKPNGYGVLFIHGSGWSASEGPDAPQLKDGDQTRLYGGALARAGYTVFAINHRAAPRFRYPAQIEDAQRAVRFVRAEAKRFGIDHERIGAVGSSSGGHLVSMLGVLDGAGDARSKSAVERAGAKVQCVVAHAPPTEMLSLGSDGRRPIPLYGFGVPTDPASAEYKQYVAGSPVTHVTPDDAPFLLLHSDDDRLVPISQSELFETALKRAVVPVKLVRVAGGGHSPSFAGAKDPPDYLGEMVRWLDRQLRPAHGGGGGR